MKGRRCNTKWLLHRMRYYSCIYLEWLRKTTTHVTRYNLSLSRDPNTVGLLSCLSICVEGLGGKRKYLTSVRSPDRVSNPEKTRIRRGRTIRQLFSVTTLENAEAQLGGWWNSWQARRKSIDQMKLSVAQDGQVETSGGWNRPFLVEVLHDKKSTL
jgi:hypothetical protein